MSQNKKSRSRFGRNTWLWEQPAHCFLLFVWKAILDSVQHFFSVTLDISPLLLSSASLSVIGDGAAAVLTTVCLFHLLTIKLRSVKQSRQKMGCKVVYLSREGEVNLSQSPQVSLPCLRLLSSGKEEEELEEPRQYSWDVARQTLDLTQFTIDRLIYFLGLEKK